MTRIEMRITKLGVGVHVDAFTDTAETGILDLQHSSSYKYHRVLEFRTRNVGTVSRQ